MNRIHLLWLLLILILPGCPYSFSGSSLPGHIKTVAVPVLANETLDATIADEVTRGLLDAFLEDGRLKVAGEARADCLVEGRVTAFDRRVYSYTTDQQPEEYIAVIKVALVIKDRVKNKDMWSDERLEATATYAASTGGGSGKTEEDARTEAIALIAQDVLARTLEQW